MVFAGFGPHFCPRYKRSLKKKKKGLRRLRLFGSEYSSQGGRKSPKGAKIFPGGQLPPAPTSRTYDSISLNYWISTIKLV